MNRRIALAGLFQLLVALALIISPIALYGSLRVTLELEIGLLMLPLGFTTVFWGSASPDPEITTIGGVFGNPVENELRRLEARRASVAHVRYASSPKEPVHCRQCYTLIAWDSAECPRCARRRECRGCGRSLFYLSGAVRCLPCVRDEVFCNCPKLRKPAPQVVGPRTRATL